jgi:hypothetical protein
MKMPGKRVKIFRWIHGPQCVVRVEVEAVIPKSDPSEPCLEPDTVRFLDQLQRLANEGKVDELAKHGEVYVRRAG